MGGLGNTHVLSEKPGTVVQRHLHRFCTSSGRIWPCQPKQAHGLRLWLVCCEGGLLSCGCSAPPHALLTHPGVLHSSAHVEREANHGQHPLFDNSQKHDEQILP